MVEVATIKSTKNSIVGTAGDDILIGTAGSDVIVGLGMWFDDRVTGRVSTFAPHARIIHLDIDGDQLGRNVPVEVSLVGDAKAVLKALVPLVKKAEVPDWIEHIETLKRDHPS